VRSYGQYCSIAKALDVVGDRWTLLIVRELLLRRDCRYTDLLHGLPGIATNLLTDRLRDMEEAGIVTREVAPPPVATALYHLSESGRQLEDVVRALGRWGLQFMPQPTGEEQFRSHWLAYPVSEFVHDREPDGPPFTIEIRTGDQPAAIEVTGGVIETRVSPTATPDLVLDGNPPVILGVLTGLLSLSDARRRGLRTRGNVKLLNRLAHEQTS
jgi:DNA-binding HxlR family transcriptional regulator